MSASEIVAKKWLDLSSEFREHYPVIYSFYYEAKRFPKIMRLFPFMSVSNLCLSKCTQYPFFVDFIIGWTPQGDIVIRKSDGRGGWVDSVEIGRHRPGTASTVLNELIPESYGGAFEGTADQISPT